MPPWLGSRFGSCAIVLMLLMQDYITEKLWDAFESGCLPIYLGAPNVRDFLPDPHSALVYSVSAHKHAFSPQTVKEPAMLPLTAARGPCLLHAWRSGCKHGHACCIKCFKLSQFKAGMVLNDALLGWGLYLPVGTPLGRSSCAHRGWCMRIACMFVHITHAALQEYGSPEKLVAAIKAIARNDTEYERYMAWKRRPWSELSPSFQAFTHHTPVYQSHATCQVSSAESIWQAAVQIGFPLCPGQCRILMCQVPGGIVLNGVYAIEATYPWMQFGAFRR